MEKLETVNQRLLDSYGRTFDLPKYRVVWANSQREIQVGHWIRTTEAGIYLEEGIGQHEIDKYPLFKDYWILETIQAVINNPELVTPFSYEPIFVFRSGDNPLPYDYEVIEKVIWHHQHPNQLLSQREIDNREEESKQQESAQMLDYLQHNKPFPNKIYDSVVVTVPGGSDV